MKRCWISRVIMEAWKKICEYNIVKDAQTRAMLTGARFNWATFVWRLMTSEWNVDVDPLSPLADGLPTDESETVYMTAGGERFQRLEDARLGHVLVKAWTEGYQSAEEVVRDVEVAALKMGIKVVGDEVDIREKWEDVLDVRDRELKCRAPEEKSEKPGSW
jgi:hypothetical protein